MKIKYHIVTLFISLGVIGCNNTTKEDAFKKDFLENCRSEMIQAISEDSGINKKMINEYCQCSLEKIENEFTWEELELIQQDSNQTDMQQKMIELSKSCLENLQHKLEQ